MLATNNTPIKRRSQAYDDHKEAVPPSVRDKVLRDSPVIAELRTNVIIKDEFTLVRDLSHHLAARYARSDSAIMIQVDHSVCLALGGTFDPCYILNLTTGPSQMGPIMNRRNAALIQSFLADILGVPAERGVVKFQPSPEENFAYNGTTLLGEIERREKQHEKQNGYRRSVEYASKKTAPSPKKSTPKMDVEAKKIERAVQEVRPEELKSAGYKSVEPKTLSSMRPKTPTTESESKRKSGSLPLGVSATILSPGGIYELPAMDMERVHSASGQRQTSGSNGLRMNPVSQSETEIASKSSPAKPKSRSSEILKVKEKRKSNSHLLSRSDSQSAPPPPPIQRSAKSSPKHERPHSFLKNEYTSPTQHNPPRSSNINRMSAPIAMREKPMRMLGVRETYIESLMSKPHLAKVFAPDQTISEEQTQGMLDQEPTANTAKRRSTMTATPKIPEPTMTSHSSDSKSVKSAKTGKRKSFMAAFKRNVVSV